jgi:hypothetical protein
MNQLTISVTIFVLFALVMIPVLVVAYQHPDAPLRQTPTPPADVILSSTILFLLYARACTAVPRTDVRLDTSTGGISDEAIRALHTVGWSKNKIAGELRGTKQDRLARIAKALTPQDEPLTDYPPNPAITVPAFEPPTLAHS